MIEKLILENNLIVSVFYLNIILIKGTLIFEDEKGMMMITHL